MAPIAPRNQQKLLEEIPLAYLRRFPSANILSLYLSLYFLSLCLISAFVFFSWRVRRFLIDLKRSSWVESLVSLVSTMVVESSSKSSAGIAEVPLKASLPRKSAFSCEACRKRKVSVVPVEVSIRSRVQHSPSCGRIRSEPYRQI